MYGVGGFGNMMLDSVRLDAYIDALKRYVTADTIVLDIGTGTGIFALVAAKLGAKHVYAIEPEPAIHVAKQIAEDNGFLGKITFIQNFSDQVDLPEKADLLVGDLRGVLPFMHYNIPSYIDARNRLLKPDAIILPERDLLFVAAGYDERWYKRIVSSPWLDNPYDINFSRGFEYASNTLSNSSEGFRGGQALQTEPCQWGQIEYATVDSTDLSQRVEWLIDSDKKINAYVVWFDAVVTDGISYSAKPGIIREGAVYGQMLFPLKAELTLQVGDRLSLDIGVRLVERNYIWSWHSQVIDESGVVKHSLKQSNFYHIALSMKSRLQRQDVSRTPSLTLNHKGQLDGVIIQAINQGLSEQAIIDLLLERSLLTDEDDAKLYVEDRLSYYTSSE